MKVSDEFWSVYKYKDHIYIETILPLGTNDRKASFIINRSKSKWDLFINSPGNEIDPLEYPLDGLLLYYLTVKTGDIFIHASGVDIKNKGYLFTGVSGKGKSTIAKLCDKSGARVIHDDRLIIRNINNRFVMFNTPVYSNETPRSANVDKIFIIDHGNDNKIIRLEKSEALSMVMANCIQHLWDNSMVVSLTDIIGKLTFEVNVFNLSFKPDKNAVQYILNWKEKS